MTCKKFQRWIHDLEVDNASPNLEAAALEHLSHCRDCGQAFEEHRQLRTLLARLPRRRASADLSLRLKIALSHQTSISRWDRFWLAFEDLMRPIAVPVTTGLAVTVVLFLVLLNTFLVNYRAYSSTGNDVDLAVVTSPRTRVNTTLNFPFNGTLNDEPLLVETYVDSNGRISNFRILQGPASPEVVQRLEEVLYFTVFDPATFFGVPTDSRAVLQFRRVNVRG